MLCDISFAIWKELKVILFWEFFDSSWHSWRWVFTQGLGITMENQLAKRKENLLNGFGATKKKKYHFSEFFFLTTELTRCLIELTSLMYGFGII